MFINTINNQLYIYIYLSIYLIVTTLSRCRGFQQFSTIDISRGIDQSGRRRHLLQSSDAEEDTCQVHEGHDLHETRLVD